MKNNIYRELLLNREAGRKTIAVLIDPEKCMNRNFAAIVATMKVSTPDMVFIGGSHAVKSLDTMIDIIREEVDSHIVLFPGDASHFTPKADAMLFLSLISGRNPEYLIGHHIKSSQEIHASGIEVIPTSYILIEGGKTSSTEYISNTRAIPRDKKEIALSTALAGELLGMRLTYLEAGSGAEKPVPSEMITYLRSKLYSPLIVGGGITDLQKLETAFNAGADLVVVGNLFERDLSLMPEFTGWVKDFNASIKIR